MEVLEGPDLKGPLCRAHEFRMVQYLKARLKDSAEKPIDLFNLHSPASKKKPLIPTIRKQILEWLRANSGNRAFFGGDLNESRSSLDAFFTTCPDISYLYEKSHKHGDLVIAKGLPRAESAACAANATSDAHQMCAVMLPLRDASTIRC